MADLRWWRMGWLRRPGSPRKSRTSAGIRPATRGGACGRHRPMDLVARRPGSPPRPRPARSVPRGSSRPEMTRVGAWMSRSRSCIGRHDALARAEEAGRVRPSGRFARRCGAEPLSGSGLVSRGWRRSAGPPSRERTRRCPRSPAGRTQRGPQSRRIARFLGIRDARPSAIRGSSRSTTPGKSMASATRRVPQGSSR